MLESTGSLVHQRSAEHHNRHCGGRTPPTSHQDTEPPEVAETCSDIRLLPWRHYMHCITAASTITLRCLGLGRY